MANVRFLSILLPVGCKQILTTSAYLLMASELMLMADSLMVDKARGAKINTSPTKSWLVATLKNQIDGLLPIPKAHH